ncbi:hypothetical protein RB195_009497 [Necator americanus]|uniref:Uncharacterized protein n=1 Tax=Necator americanus TaxID=51031 RepID=A0ABR1CTJ9_NECAM
MHRSSAKSAKDDFMRNGWIPDAIFTLNVNAKNISFYASEGRDSKSCPASAIKDHGRHRTCQVQQNKMGRKRDAFQRRGTKAVDD